MQLHDRSLASLERALVDKPSVHHNTGISSMAVIAIDKLALWIERQKNTSPSESGGGIYGLLAENLIEPCDSLGTALVDIKGQSVVINSGKFEVCNRISTSVLMVIDLRSEQGLGLAFSQHLYRTLECFSAV